MARSWAPPPQIGEFSLGERLGRGATAEVWLARDTLLDRLVALKIASAPASPETRTRFRIEARAIAKLHHPNLLAIHHVGEVGERPFIVAEYFSGRSLDEIDRPVQVEQVLAIGIDLARGLAAAHQAGVLHRDIKPANACLGDDGVAKLIDFGLAKLADTPASASGAAPSAADASPVEFDATAIGASVGGRIAGTPLYMAPETWRGEPPTPRTDVYSLGALLFELLVGVPPCIAGLGEGVDVSLEELRTRVLAGALGDLVAFAPSASPSLVSLVTRCLRLHPAERPSADELCDALAGVEALGAIRSEAPGDPRDNPYRGLLAFNPEHRALFFGREPQTAAVIAEVRASPFVLVAGPSGAGKSSLVRAGVVPRVARGALSADAEWRTVIFVPGRRPIEALAHAVAPVLGVSEADAVVRLERSSTWLANELRAAAVPLLLVIDQLEEVWTLAPALERRAFFEVVAALALAARTVRTVATLRADFLDRVEDMGALQATALRALVPLHPMTPEALRRAIALPAELRGVEIEPRLVERLVDVMDGGSLPLLEFALAELYERRDPARQTIGIGDLDALGGVEGALAAHADAALARLPEPVRREARWLLLALVTVERTRARREEHDLLAHGGERVRAALDALVEARLVVAGAGERGPAYEVAHEALLTGWPTLRAWLDEEAAAREAWERVRRAAAEWARVGKVEEALFGARQLYELGALEVPPLDGMSEAFLEASRGAASSARRRKRAVVLGLPLLFTLLLSIAWFVPHTRQRTEITRAVARARALDREAEDAARAADVARAAALALFERDDLALAEEEWKRVLALEEDADRHRRDVGTALDQALALDAGDAATRALLADVALARVLAAERLHKDALARELRARLAVYDDGSRAAWLRAAAHVEVETEPPGASITLARYREDSSGRMIEVDAAPLAARTRRDLEPGSYLLVARASERYSTRLPFLARRGEELALRIVLPRAADVPEGMIYVPAGRARYGSREDEDTRVLLLMHQPVHDVDVGAFLIGRTEVTNREYAAYLDALPLADRKARLASGLALTPDGRVALKVRDETFALAEPYCREGQACVDGLTLPVDGASREDGERFAEWLSQSGRVLGARLCTDREWERAARGADDRRYPSGDGELGPDDACTRRTYGGDAQRAGPCRAGSHPASRSPFGVDDMVGSEWEWTSGPADRALPRQAVIRGAGWYDDGMFLILSNRGVQAGTIRFRSSGLRICAHAR